MNDSIEDLKKALPSLEEWAADHLTPATHPDTKHKYACPCCNSGGNDRADSDSAFTIYPETQKWKCFQCNKGGDILDLMAAHYGISNQEAIKRAREETGLFLTGNTKPYEGRTTTNTVNYKGNNKTTPQTGLETVTGATGRTIRQDFTEGRARSREYIKNSQGNIEDPAAVNYLLTRGITKEQAQQQGLGYDAKRRSIVLPFKGSSSYYYVLRNIEPKRKSERHRKPNSTELGGQPIYNPGLLRSKAAFAICEGAFDAIALELAGLPAMAICSKNNQNTIHAIIGAKYSGVVYVAIDKGEPEQAETIEKLTAAGIQAEALPIEYNEDEKDPADVWNKRPEYLTEICKTARESLEEKKRDEAIKLLEANQTFTPKKFLTDLLDGINKSDPIRTGFNNLDEQLDGGIMPGLYIIGAASSLGKTTLTLQIANNIAAQQIPVLFVSVEQSGAELLAKSLASIMRKAGAPVPYSDILKKTAIDQWNNEQVNAYGKAMNEYDRNVSKWLLINQPNNRPKLEDIKGLIEEIKKGYGRPPVVFIDYLQLIAGEQGDSDKVVMDKTVTGLRQVCREYNTPIWAVSSINRQSYGGTISPEAFKESGSIEYGADVLLGMQPLHLNDVLSKADTRDSKATAAAKEYAKARSSDIRDIALVVLKNRNGRPTDQNNPVALRLYASSGTVEIYPPDEVAPEKRQFDPDSYVSM